VKRIKTPTTIIVWFFNFNFGVVAEKDFLILFCCSGHARTRPHKHNLLVAEKRLLCFCSRDIIHLSVAEILIAKSVVCTVVGIAFWNLGFVDFFGKRDSSESLQRRK
jgi:tetrahydromethanopterin S-methyltransferase subunit C